MQSTPGLLFAVWTVILLNSVESASPLGDVVGKITVGYQGWFSTPTDGSPVNAWWGWAPDGQQPLSPTNVRIISWPDVRDYTTTFPTSYPNLGNGQTANVFSSFTDQTVDTHFRWMQENDIDTAALQRFNPNTAEGPIRDLMAAKVRAAAEARGRKFYIMYDVTQWTNFQTEIKTDWTNKMSAHTASPAYAIQNGKFVVGIWGFGFNTTRHPATPESATEVISWFKGQGCYVMGGVPSFWRTETGDSKAGFLPAYRLFDMISPWMVGRIASIADSDNFLAQVNSADQQFCNANNIDYQPCVLPGDLSNRHRVHGDFMWRQFFNMISAGCQGIYISMFDEYNEGNQIAKTAESAAFVPVGSGFVTLDEDGVACSADYYLRLTGDGGRMLKGLISLTNIRPTSPTVVPVTSTTQPPTTSTTTTTELSTVSTVTDPPATLTTDPPTTLTTDFSTTSTADLSSILTTAISSTTEIIATSSISITSPTDIPTTSTTTASPTIPTSRIPTTSASATTKYPTNRKRCRKYKYKQEMNKLSKGQKNKINRYY